MLAAGVLHQKWLDPNALVSYVSSHDEWTTFGVLQRRVGGTPLIAPISIFLD